MSVNARPASAQVLHEIPIDSDDRPMSQDAEPNAGHDAEPDAEPNAKRDAEPDAKSYSRQMSQQRQLTHSPSGRELGTWISESEWTDYIQDDPHIPQGPKSAVSIFRVPEFLKNTKREAYVPQRVSLGPYHHRIAKFSPMGYYKGKALRGMMEKFNNNKGSDSNPYNINMDFSSLAKKEILNLEKEIRYSYHDSIDCTGETLSLILSLDGCFLLQVLRNLGREKTMPMDADIIWADIWALEKYTENKFAGITDILFDKLMLLNEENEIIGFVSRDIVNDILMLENQVPFIVLRKLLQLELKSTHDVDEMLLIMMGCIWRLLKPYNRFEIKKWCREKLTGEEVQHLLGFLYEAIVHPGFRLIEDTDRGTVCNIRIDCLCRCTRKHQDGGNEAPNQFQRICPAVELRNAGIKFKPCHGGIEKIKFDRKSTTIFLPPICITDITDVLFRNLIAFEMCRPSQISYVSCYVNIMDNLIDSEKDVALLRRMGVLTNWLGRDKEVVDLFNSLSKAAAPVNQYDAFYRLAERVNAHYEREIRVQLQLAKLVQDYCSTPWKALASAAAIVLLVLALVQTIFSVIAVYK